MERRERQRARGEMATEAWGEGTTRGEGGRWQQREGGGPTGAWGEDALGGVPGRAATLDGTSSDGDSLPCVYFPLPVNFHADLPSSHSQAVVWHHSIPLILSDFAAS